MLAGTVVAVVYMFTSFVPVDANDLFHDQQAQATNEFRTDIYYLQFYELLEKAEHADDDEHPELAAELRRQMERLKARICEADPEWERCNK